MGNKLAIPLTHAASHGHGQADQLYDFGGHSLTGYQETMPRWAISSSQLPSTGRIYLAYLTADASQTVTTITFFCVTAGSAMTLLRLGVYSVDGSNNLTLMAQTADVHASAGIAGNTLYTVTFDASVSLTAALVRGGRYAIGTITVGTTAPAISGMGMGSSGLFNLAPRMTTSLVTQTDLVTPITNAAQAGSTLMPWFALS